MSFHSDTVLVCQTPAKLIVYHHALELAFSCLQQCTLTYWGMFSLFISFQFLSAKCWCSVSIHTLIVVASTMFAEECCFSFFVIRTYSEGVVFTRFWTDHGEAAGGQLDWLCYSHIYLFDNRLLLSDTSLIFPIIFSWFPIFSTRKDSVKVLCWEKVTPEPFDHVVLSCCLPGKKVFFCVSLWCCEFSFQLAFLSLCRRKRRFKKEKKKKGKKVLCFIFSLFHYVYFLYLKWWWLCHTFHFGHHY